MKILCVEDDEGLAVLLQQTLLKQHYQVELATDGLMGWDLAEVDTYDLILLDWMLPNFTGVEFCHRLRTERQSVLNPNRDTPVLLMTALDSVTNKIIGLNAGADDYVVKPFDLEELLARIRALLRRSQGDRSPLLQWGKLCLNPNSCEVTYQGNLIGLAAKEYELLELFLRHPDQIFSLNRLLTALWSVEEMPGEGAVRTHIKSLRQKLKQVGLDDPIDTVYKLGYRLKHQGIEEPEKKEIELEKRREKERAQSPPSSMPPELWKAWQEVRQTYCDRLSTIQQAVVALQNQTLTPEQQQLAEREAHTLVGSLGSFGLDEASRISRQIQQILKQTKPLGQPDMAKLLPLIAALSQQLGNPIDEKTDMIDLLKPASIPMLLIVDDDLSWAKGLAEEALSWGWQAKIATTFGDAQHCLQNQTADVMLLSLDYLDPVKNGLEFLATVRFHHPTLTVVPMTIEASLERRIEAIRLETRCFLKKPIAPTHVLAAIAAVLYPQDPSSTQILLLDSDAALLQYLRKLLEFEGYQITCLCQPEHVWQTLEQTNPDLLILEVDLYPSAQFYSGLVTNPPLNGIELCQAIRSDPDWYHLPILFLSVPRDYEMIQRCFAAGADDFVYKPVVAQDLLTHVRNRLDQRNRWRLMSQHSQEYKIPS
ncbi:MAG: response regulator [Elainellaceae cyanobacterium]